MTNSTPPEICRWKVVVTLDLTNPSVTRITRMTVPRAAWWLASAIQAASAFLLIFLVYAKLWLIFYFKMCKIVRNFGETLQNSGATSATNLMQLLDFFSAIFWGDHPRFFDLVWSQSRAACLRVAPFRVAHFSTAAVALKRATWNQATPRRICSPYSSVLFICKIITLVLLKRQTVAVLGWGQGAQAPQILPRPPNF